MDHHRRIRTVRQRQDIRRLKSRWIDRLAAMPPQKRFAILAAIDEFTRAENGTDADAAGDRDRGHIPYHHRFRLMLEEEKL
jgi:hypothetical protein